MPRERTVPLVSSNDGPKGKQECNSPDTQVDALPFLIKQKNVLYDIAAHLFYWDHNVPFASSVGLIHSLDESTTPATVLSVKSAILGVSWVFFPAYAEGGTQTHMSRRGSPLPPVPRANTAPVLLIDGLLKISTSETLIPKDRSTAAGDPHIHLPHVIGTPQMANTQLYSSTGEPRTFTRKASTTLPHTQGQTTLARKTS